LNYSGVCGSRGADTHNHASHDGSNLRHMLATLIAPSIIIKLVATTSK
jgi:hypothetical protein